MAFLNPLFLIGTLAAALPVLVHLVRRTQARRVEFASLMFLRRIEQKTVRRRKLRNLLLLAMRCAALMLLALAFARPYFTFQQSALASSDKPASVILIDGSYSMRYGNRFNLAKQAAHNIVSNFAANEQAAVVVFSQLSDVLMPLKSERAEMIVAIDQAEAGLGATDYLQAMQAADSILREAAPGNRRIFIISDFQNAGWNRAAPPLKLADDIKLVPVEISEGKGSNLALSDLKAEAVVYGQKYNNKLAAHARNFGPDGLPEAAVDLKLNDFVVERRQVALDSGSMQLVEFSGFNLPEGSNRAMMEITGDDFTLDNRHFFIVRREEQTKVLAIETAVRGRSDTFYLQQSLAAGENNQHSLDVKSSGAVSPNEIGSSRVIIVNDAASINVELAAALKDFVTRGGGLILVAAKRADADEFNRIFEGIAPATIGEPVVNRGYTLMSQIKTDHPIFSPFAKSGRLASTRVYGYRRATLNEAATTIAALDDGSPLIIEGAAGSGKVLLVTTSFDTAWNDLPLTPMYLPLVRQMLEYLGGRPAASSYTVGQVFTVKPDVDGSFPLIESPSGQRVDDARKTPTGEQAVLAKEPGFYRLRYRDRMENVAVNLDASESDFSPLDVEEFIATVSPKDTGASERAAQSPVGTPAEIESRQRIWLVLLLAALALFVAEALLARRIRIAKLIG